MADPVKEGAGKAGSFLIHKLGPLPIWVYIAVGVTGYLYLQNRQKATTAATAANQQTDPAGNIGSIDPATGYVYGTPEDLAALAANNAGTSSPSGSSGQGATTGGQTYADNNAWGIAAINFLVGLGIDAATANQAVELYLTSQPLTTAQQADVNLAIAKLGPPPSLPGPVTGNPPPVTGPPGGTGGAGTVVVPKVTGMTASAAKTKLESVGLVAGSEGKNGGTAIVNSQTPGSGAKVAKGSTVDLGVVQAGQGGGKPPVASVPAPTGLAVTTKHSTSVGFKWNRSRGANGYSWTVTDMATKAAKTGETGTGLTATAGGLAPGHSYVIDVWALPRAPGNSAHAEVSVTLPRTG